MAAATNKQTLSEGIYVAVHRELLNGALAPGQRLKVGELASRFGVSLSVVREALTRLAEQGLVVASPQRGFAVAALSVDDLRDLTRARVLIEALVLRESIANGDVAWEAALIASLHTLERTRFIDDHGDVSEDWTAAHREYHRALLTGAGNTRLESVATSLRDCAELYRQWSRSLAHDEDRDIAAEHRQILEATLARDADAATAALTAHIERTSAALLAYAGNHDGQPAGPTPQKPP
jgi:DNA-binding GntR family transcriptional regulator